MSNLTIENIIAQFDKWVTENEPTNHKIDLLKDICKPHSIEYFINKNNEFELPLWLILLNTGHHDIFNKFSKHIPKNESNQILFLSTNLCSLKIDDNWFPKEKFEEIILTDIFKVGNENMLFALTNGLFKNFEDTVIKITENLAQYSSAFNKKNSYNRLSAASVKTKTLDLIYNHYYNLTQDKEILQQAAQSLIKSDVLKINSYSGIQNFSEQFRYEFLDLFLAKEIQYKPIYNAKKVFFQIIENKEFPQHKAIIFDCLCRGHQDLLNYALVTDYITKNDLINFTKDNELKSSMESKYFEKVIKESTNINKLKL